MSFESEEKNTKFENLSFLQTSERIIQHQSVKAYGCYFLAGPRCYQKLT
jgi:hypothetical protein